MLENGLFRFLITIVRENHLKMLKQFSKILKAFIATDIFNVSLRTFFLISLVCDNVCDCEINNALHLSLLLLRNAGLHLLKQFTLKYRIYCTLNTVVLINRVI